MAVSFSTSSGNVSRTDNGYYLVQVTVNGTVKVVAVSSTAPVPELKAFLRDDSGLTADLATITTIGTQVQTKIDAVPPLEDTLDSS